VVYLATVVFLVFLDTAVNQEPVVFLDTLVSVARSVIRVSVDILDIAAYQVLVAYQAFLAFLVFLAILDLVSLATVVIAAGLVSLATLVSLVYQVTAGIAEHLATVVCLVFLVSRAYRVTAALVSLAIADTVVGQGFLAIRDTVVSLATVDIAVFRAIVAFQAFLASQVYLGILDLE